MASCLELFQEVPNMDAIKSFIYCIANNIIKIASCATIATCMSCSNPAHIHIVLPDGFSGVFEIAGDEIHCMLTDAANCKKGLFIIPRSGMLITSSVKAFHEWHSLEVTTAGGEVIPTEPQAKLGCHAITYLKDSEERPAVWFFVGDIDQFYRDHPNLVDIKPDSMEPLRSNTDRKARE